VEAGVKVAVVKAVLRVAAGDGEVVAATRGRVELHHAEALANQVNAAVIRDQTSQLVVSDAVNLHVEVLRLGPEQRVAPASPDHDSAVSRISQLTYDLLNGSW